MLKKVLIALAVLVAVLVLYPNPVTAQDKWVFTGVTQNDAGKWLGSFGFSAPEVLGVRSIWHAEFGSSAAGQVEITKWFDIKYFKVFDYLFLVAGPGVDYASIGPDAGVNAYVTVSVGAGVHKVVYKFKPNLDGSIPKIGLYLAAKYKTGFGDNLFNNGINLSFGASFTPGSIL